jgi:NAD(P)H-dependent flavin oxidoreductase YrpB (nitropropane dioxygenase family)
MIRTAFCDAVGVAHPLALGGMGGVLAPALVAAVSEAGGLGALACAGLTTDQIRAATGTIRQRTQKPFALNFLLFSIDEAAFAAALELKPPIVAFAWPKPEQDLKAYFDRAHAIGAKITFMASDVPGAKRGADAGADVIIAQGTEGGGHVAWMSSMVLTPMTVKAVAPKPVLAAGGFADGRGLAAALALGAAGVLMGTRFLATTESSLHENFKRAIVASDGHDSLLTEIPDIAAGQVWPGAMSRAKRNRFIERWVGREWALRRDQKAAAEAVMAARKAGDVDEAPLSFGQDAGLIDDIVPAAELVARILGEAEEILRARLPRLLG